MRVLQQTEPTYKITHALNDNQQLCTVCNACRRSVPLSLGVAALGAVGGPSGTSSTAALQATAGLHYRPVGESSKSAIALQASATPSGATQLKLKVRLSTLRLYPLLALMVVLTMYWDMRAEKAGRNGRHDPVGASCKRFVSAVCVRCGCVVVSQQLSHMPSCTTHTHACCITPPIGAYGSCSQLAWPVSDAMAAAGLGT